MRINEVLGLKWENVDLKNGIIYVREKLELKKENGKPIFSKPKTKKSERSIKITSSLINEFQKIKKSQEIKKHNAGEFYEDYNLVFTLPNGSPVDLNNLRRRDFNKLAEKCDLPRIRIHDMRHSAATYLLDVGTPLEIVQEILGHSTPIITKTLYIKDNVKRQTNAMEKLDQIFK